MNTKSINRFFIVPSVYFEVTTRYNLKCIHCYNSSGEYIQDLSLSCFSKVINELTDIQQISISGGEPLMHPNIFEMLDYATQKNIQVLLLTNGTLLDDCIVSKILNKNIKIQISLDGATERSHDRVRGDGSFEMLIAGVELLRKYKVNFIINSVVTEHNYCEVDEMKAFANQIGAENIRFSPLQIKGRALSHSYLRPTFEQSVDQHNIYEYKDTDCPIFANKQGISITPKIRADGSVFICQVFENDEDILGNVYREQINEIIRSNKIHSVYELYNNRKHGLKQCTHCFWQSVCGRGCPGVNSWLETDGLCDIRRYAFEQILHKNHNVRR